MGYYQTPGNYSASQEDVLKGMVISKLFNGLVLAVAISLIIIYTGIDPIFYILAFAAEIIAIIGYFFARKESTIETLYYIFVVSSSILLGATLQYIVWNIPEGLQVVTTTFATTALVVGFAYYKSQTTYIDTYSLGRKLFPLGLTFLAVAIFGMFFSFGDTGYLIFSIFGAGLFTMYFYWNLGRLQNKQYSSPARLAWSLYWDILLIFRFMLQIMLMLVGRD